MQGIAANHGSDGRGKMGRAWRDADADREVGRRLAAARKSQGLSQREVGVLLGITAQQVYNLEKGRSEAKVSQLRRLANAYGISVHQLLEWPVPLLFCWCDRHLSVILHALAGIELC